MGNFPVGPLNEPANEFMGCNGWCTNYLTWQCLGNCSPICGAMCCPEKTLCCYDKNILKAVAKFEGKKTPSPGPCSEPFLQMACCGPCTYCLLYRGQ